MNSKQDKYPVLIGDIGGTNARFGLIKDPYSSIQFLASLKVVDYETPEKAILSVLSTIPQKPKSFFLALAAPITSPVIRMTNSHWLIDLEQLGISCGVQEITLINDFPPIGISLARMKYPQDLWEIGSSRLLRENDTCAIIGAGTGCGTTALIPVDNCWLLQPSEMGHTHLGPEGEDEQQLWNSLKQLTKGAVTVENLLSGSGLMRIYQALYIEKGIFSSSLTPEDILKNAQNNDALSIQTIQLFLSILARVAGDLALIFQASGGVFIAGGIVPRILDFIEPGWFRNKFENKPPLERYLKNIPIYVITNPFPALYGLAELISRPEKYLVPTLQWNRKGKFL